MQIPYMRIKLTRCKIQNENKNCSLIRKRYSTRDVELRMRSKRKYCTEMK